MYRRCLGKAGVCLRFSCCGSPFEFLTKPVISAHLYGVEKRLSDSYSNRKLGHSSYLYFFARYQLIFKIH